MQNSKSKILKNYVRAIFGGELQTKRVYILENEFPDIQAVGSLMD